MPGTADVVVVGGGVIGASITCALASRGARVTLVEKDALASGASGRSSALVRMHYTSLPDARLAWASFPVFRDWPERMGGPAVFTRTGFLAVVSPADAGALRRNVQLLRGIGVDTVALAPDDVKALQPFAHVDDIGAAAWEPASGYADPSATVDGFRRAAQDRGAVIRQWTAVTRIIATSSRVTGVETTAGPIAAGAVVVAAGAWTRRLCRDLGFALPLRPKGVDTVVVRRPPDLPAHAVYIDWVQGTYFRPEGGGLTLVGVPCQVWDVDPDTLGTALPAEAPLEGARILTHRIPAMERATLARGYRAFDGYSRDRHAIIGAVDGIDGLYLATAFSGSGFKISPAVGLGVAELVLDGRARSVDLEPFALARFAAGRSPEGPYPYTPRRDHLDPAADPRAWS